MSKSDNLLALLTYIPVDVCYTNLLFHFPWESAYRTGKWSDVLKLKCFDGIRLLADAIFNLMEQEGSQCPTVTKDDNKIFMTWTNELRMLRIVLCEDRPITYYRGHNLDKHPCAPITIDSEEEFFRLLPILSHFVNPLKVYDGSGSNIL